MKTAYYTLDLVVEAPDKVADDELDLAVQAVVENSTAREAIDTGLYHADFDTLGEDDEGVTVVSLQLARRE
ncbi:MAG TPA: hypothetical protein VFX15_03150 [Actinomycetes bacterium]|nr:hypothetical protein [Actinomycetes bacterium]